MNCSVAELRAFRDAFVGTARDIDHARRALDLGGVTAVDKACRYLAAASRRLQPATSDNQLPRTVRRAAERCRATLASHLLAADGLEAAGVPLVTVLDLVRRATEVAALEAMSALDDLPVDLEPTSRRQ